MGLADDPVSRELGVRVLRELGSQGDAGRRPFSAEAVPLLRDRLRTEDQPRVLGRRVRFHVAAAIPSLVDPDRVDAATVTALRRLCRDPDTRHYALYALVEELPGLDRVEAMAAAASCRDDPDTYSAAHGFRAAQDRRYRHHVAVPPARVPPAHQDEGGGSLAKGMRDYLPVWLRAWR